MNKKKSINNIIIAVLAFIVLIAIDQITKKMAVEYLYNKPAYEIIPGVFELHFLVNHGAAFGILQNHPYFFATVTIIVIAALFYIYLKICNYKKFFLINTLIILLCAGAAGNLIDRLIQGYVVDFLYFKLIDFPIFNIADCYVVVATGLFLVSVIFIYDDEFLDELSCYIKHGKRGKDE